ncbi:DUF5623 domain-containing protein [Kiloniella litopenaei]|uniref:DUF5623 domain-containing protein n=1 Tax=Kiloniella litopenaei TaxID=1549748 RepID=UPI003BAC8E80
MNKSIQPSSLNGVKRLAKQIKRNNSLPHHKALDIAAQAASFENFKHAKKHLENAKNQNSLFLTVYWKDTDSYSSGRETLKINLNKPLKDISNKSELKSAPGLGWFRQVAPDHLVHDDLLPDQKYARKSLCKAVRVIRFIEATGLKPSRNRKAISVMTDRESGLPRKDHSTYWDDPHTGQFILIDEPYLDPVVEGERAQWAQKNNWHLQASRWPGMYYPYNCSLFAATDASTSYNFADLMAKIDAIPFPITEDDEWKGISVKGNDTFISPQANSPQDKRRAKSKGTIWRLSSKKTAPILPQSPFNKRRPNAIMPVTTHKRVARIIKAIIQSDQKPWEVNWKLEKVRSKLEDWFFSEHRGKETENYDFFHYGEISKSDPYVQIAKTTKGNIKLLINIKKTLQKCYVDCEPLRKMIKKIDTSINLIEKSNK